MVTAEEVKRYLRGVFPEASTIDSRPALNNYEGKVFIVLHDTTKEVYRTFLPHKFLLNQTIDRLIQLDLGTRMKESGFKMVLVDSDGLTTGVTDEKI